MAGRDFVPERVQVRLLTELERVLSYDIEALYFKVKGFRVCDCGCLEG